MILMFSNDNRCMRWRAAQGSRAIQGRHRFASSLQLHDIPDRAGNTAKLEAIGYFLHNGGSRIKRTVSLLTPENFNEALKCVKFLPEYNDLTFKIAGYWMKKRPDIPHVLLCDTAFFNALPYTARNYAIPYQLQRKDIRRYGRYGLSQLWLLKQIKPHLPAPQAKIITVCLGNHTSVSAIKGGKPVETSSGFTPIEGLLSSTGSGSIDPTIVFHLHSSGMSFNEINELLSKKSGFAALTGGHADMASILNSRGDNKIMAPRDFYCYNVIKWIGSFIATLGGLDALVFLSERPEEYLGIISKICRSFAFLGLKCRKPQNAEEILLDLTEKPSLIKTFCMRHDRWRIMEDNIKLALQQWRKTQ